MFYLERVNSVSPRSYPIENDSTLEKGTIKILLGVAGGTEEHNIYLTGVYSNDNAEEAEIIRDILFPPEHKINYLCKGLIWWDYLKKKR